MSIESKSVVMLSLSHPVFSSLYEELQRSYSRFPKRLNSFHEGYAIVLEEMDEFWNEIKKDPQNSNPINMRTEAVQTAAMLLRVIIDLIDKPNES